MCDIPCNILSWQQMLYHKTLSIQYLANMLSWYCSYTMAHRCTGFSCLTAPLLIAFLGVTALGLLFCCQCQMQFKTSRKTLIILIATFPNSVISYLRFVGKYSMLQPQIFPLVQSFFPFSFGLFFLLCVSVVSCDNYTLDHKVQHW